MWKLGLGALTAPLRWLQQVPWLESPINFPFLCLLHCHGGLLFSCWGIRTAGITGGRGRSWPPLRLTSYMTKERWLQEERCPGGSGGGWIVGLVDQGAQREGGEGLLVGLYSCCPPEGPGPFLSQIKGLKRAVRRSVLLKRCLFSQRIFSRLSWEVPGGWRCAAWGLGSARLPCPSASPSSSRSWRPHCWGSPRPSGSSGRAPRLLSIISLQLSLQECSRLRGGGRARCWLWQQVNKMCSQLGVSSWPGQGGREPAVPNLVICTPSP